MADIGATTATNTGSSTSTNTAAKAGKGLQDLDLNQFLQLMVSELMNQDPLNPMDNTQLVQQIGELRSIAASDQLTTSLQALQTQQSLTTAASLIGKEVSAIDTNGNNVSGTISAVTVQVDQTNNNKRSYQVKIGDQTIDLSNVREVDG
jgi:flagellar basal-body rod modification protein FlgD